MSCHVVREHAAAVLPVLTLRAHPLRVALVGQPNVGKSVVFGRLTGRYVTVSNYPGTTVAITKGRALVGAEVCDIIDTPGVNALEGAVSEDERITRDVLTSGGADLVVQVADARNLRRALMLTAQIAAFGKPVVLALNMIDEAFARGISIDSRALSAALGIPVVETVAVDGQGFAELREALAHGAVPDAPAERPPLERASWANDLTQRVRLTSTLSLSRIPEMLARATRRPLTGLPILAVVLYALYLFVGVFGAQTLVKLFEDGLFGKGINPASIWLADRFIPVAFVRDFLVGEYGLITMGLTYAIAIVLPVVATFFLMFGFLEDSGYIPRLAVFSDRIFRAMGLNGKAVLPMVLGLGCDTMATMTTRILATPKERLIAILLLALGIPCSAQLATILGILGGVSLGVALGLSRLSSAVAGPILVNLYSIPKVTLYPLVLLCFGLGLAAKVAFGVMHGMIPMTIFTMNAIRQMKPVLLRSSKMMRLTAWQTASTIVLPAVMPEVLSGIRLGFSLTLLGVLIGEMFASKRGLGFLVTNAMNLGDTETIMAVAVLLTAFAVTANGLLINLGSSRRQ